MVVTVGLVVGTIIFFAGFFVSMRHIQDFDESTLGIRLATVGATIIGVSFAVGVAQLALALIEFLSE